MKHLFFAGAILSILFLAGCQEKIEAVNSFKTEVESKAEATKTKVNETVSDVNKAVESVKGAAKEVQEAKEGFNKAADDIKAVAE